MLAEWGLTNMNKTVKWILFGLVGLIVIAGGFKMIAGNKDEGGKVLLKKQAAGQLLKP